MDSLHKDHESLKAWVVFSAHADLPWLRILKPGFRHCAVILNDGLRWIILDPLSNYIDICIPDLQIDFDLPQWMCGQGYIVMPAPIKRTVKPAPWSLFTCVEAVKRVLGIRKRGIFTPWQLYQHLKTLQPLLSNA